jgi:hypothetical protein
MASSRQTKYARSLYIKISSKKYVVRSKSSRNLNFAPNGYEYIEKPIGVSSHTILESVWQAASSCVLGLLFVNVFTPLCFREFAVLRWLT